MWDYRGWLKAEVERRVKAKEDISFSKLATRTRIQRTYLSQVIHRKHHLNNDQVYAIAIALGLTAEERQYLILMSEWERCKLAARKQQLAARLQEVDARRLGIATDVSQPRPDALDDYFCDPMGEVVFRFLEIGKDPLWIRQRLGLRDERWDEIVVSLVSCGFLQKAGERLTILRRAVFPPADSPAERIRNIQGRLKVAHNKLKQRHIDEFMYNWWFIANPERKKALKIQYLHLLQDIYQESLTTPHENVYQLSIDLFTP